MMSVGMIMPLIYKYIVTNKRYNMKHLSIRVPWHDNNWNGTVCCSPAANPFCMTLHNILEQKPNLDEDRIASKKWSKLDPKSLPACKGENGGFMNEDMYRRTFVHVYAYNSSLPHSKLLPTTVDVLPFTAFGIPFRYMSKDSQKDIDIKCPSIPADEDAPFSTSWIFGANRQRHILHWFLEDIVDHESLVVFYCKSGNPIDEDSSRLIVGLGEVSHAHDIIEFDTTADYTYPAWDLMIEHSIRPDLKKSKGFLLPYKEYLSLDEQIFKDKLHMSKTQAIDEIKLTLSEIGNNPKIFQELSYGCEKVSNHCMLIILTAARNSVEAVIKHGLIGGDWKRQLRWIDEQIGNIKRASGPFPGFAEALRAIGVNYAYLIEHDLRFGKYLEPKGNPWLSYSDLLSGKITIPDVAYNSELCYYKTYWQNTSLKQKEVLMLLSRFEMETDQMQYWLNKTDQYDELLANPYLISEDGDIYDVSISTQMIDYGVIPDPQVQGDCIPSSPSRIDSLIDERRIRSLVIEKLKYQASQGDTLLSSKEMEEHLKDILDKDNMLLPAGYLLKLRPFMDEKLAYITTDESVAIQLKDLSVMEQWLQKRLAARASKEVKTPLKEDWSTLVKMSIGYAETNQQSVMAANDQINALNIIVSRRLSVLTGPAGTGKTTVVKAFLASQAIQEEGVLLLAPTGKARVRLGSMSANSEALTVAQFLTRQGFFDWQSMRAYIPTKEKQRKYVGAKNIIIDECSMLTLTDFYVLLNAIDLKMISRIVLIGDPYQLPPIGEGRPFFDLCSFLDNDSVLKDTAIAHLHTVVRTIQQGGHSDILTLASWFSGNDISKDADEVFEKIRKKSLNDDLKVYSWKNADELKLCLLNVLEKELPSSDLSLAERIQKSIGMDDTYYAMEHPEVVEGFQLLTPVKSPMWGTLQLNKYFQEWVDNTNVKFALEVAPEYLFHGDKVIQLQNEKRESYPSKIKFQLSNGQIGFVGYANGKYKVAKVVFNGIPNESFNYYQSTNDDTAVPIELAYAITIHKSQGSDFDNVLVILPKNGRILSRELIYTAITRAKKKLILLVEDSPQWLLEYTKPVYSVMAHRNTNLFKYFVRDSKVDVPFIEGLIHKTEKEGMLVRSKSEVIIVNMLYHAGIDFEYEKFLEENGKRCLPDFTFEDAAGDPIIWEHLGMLTNPAYKEAWEKKLAFYESIGFHEGENLFTSRDHDNGSIDCDDIKRIISEIEELL